MFVFGDMGFRDYFERVVRNLSIFGVGIVVGAVGTAYFLRDYGKDYAGIKTRVFLDNFAQGALEKGIDIAENATAKVLGDIVDEQSRKIGKVALEWGLEEYEKLDRDLKIDRERRELEKKEEDIYEFMKGKSIVRKT